MLRNIRSLFGYKILAMDGEVGDVDEFFFDDVAWTIRYLVVDASPWLPRRRVFISPVSLDKPDWVLKKFPVVLSREKIKNSPRIDMDKPVSRQCQIELYTYYGWPFYWPAGGYYNTSTSASEEGDPHLRDIKEVIGCHIHAIDGEIGHVDDFIIDDEEWIIRYLVIDTKNWLPGKRVLISPQWIKKTNWVDKKGYIEVSRNFVKNSPEHDPAVPVTREYENRLYDYYIQPKYWI